MQRKQDTVQMEVVSAVDRYLEKLFTPPDAALTATLDSITESNMPPIQVSASQGKLLHLLTKISGAKRVLELGTLAGYSTIWLARALPTDGRIVSLEARADYAQVATRNIARAGLSDRVEIRVGLALESLDAMIRGGEPPFDLVFIDADKKSYAAYLDRILRLTRTGSLIVADNIIRRGDILDTEHGDESARGAREFLDALAVEARVEAVAIQMVGTKGHDGMALASVK